MISLKHMAWIVVLLCGIQSRLTQGAAPNSDLRATVVRLNETVRKLTEENRQLKEANSRLEQEIARLNARPPAEKAPGSTTQPAKLTAITSGSAKPLTQTQTVLAGDSGTSNPISLAEFIKLVPANLFPSPNMMTVQAQPINEQRRAWCKQYRVIVNGMLDDIYRANDAVYRIYVKSDYQFLDNNMHSLYVRLENLKNPETFRKGQQIRLVAPVSDCGRGKTGKWSLGFGIAEIVP